MVSGELASHLQISLTRAVIGFLIGSGLGLLFGAMLGLSSVAEQYVDPTLQMLRTVPHLALTPLFILWFGLGEDQKVKKLALQSGSPFRGSSPAGQAVAAKHSDVYLTWGEPPAQVEQKINEVRKLAETEGRKVRFGIRLHVIVRETEEEAWNEADRLIKYVDQDTINAAQKVFSVWIL